MEYTICRPLCLDSFIHYNVYEKYPGFLCNSSLFSYAIEYYPIVWIYSGLYIHLFHYLDCSLSEAIVNETAKNIFAQVFI